MILGLGHDVVDVARFAAQLAQPGTRMRALFSPRELRQAAMRAQSKDDGEAVHLAARWAGKEAVLKAWCEALASAGVAQTPPYTLDDFPWARVEILDDSRGVPHVALAPDVEECLAGSLRGSGVDARRDDGSARQSDVATRSGGVITRHDAAAQWGNAVPSRDNVVAQREYGATAPSASPCFTWHLSLSHDGPVASAVALLGLAR